MSEMTAAGREDITVQNAVDGKLGLGDLRMDPAVLAHQAAVAEAGGNPQLAENFRRAAELATVDDEQVMALYEALRPHRSTAAELDELRTSLIARGAPRCAALVEQAAAVYARRGLLR
ncbi:diol dehydratase small subunit [Mycobacterium sp. 4D054]|uniref:diol dehydratase small subunit n=1 Tax=unclassified Mycobacterium TaxID=2642494 RepID=UPI0021B46902|nr:diol dehydratase small subunit [Mycobacterium sp. SMC-8]UXA13241.1 diol dehydratase small subunit [Mycobacterium sp. SMC-8]